MAVQPKPWPGLSYESNYLEVVVGEEVKPLKPRIPLGNMAQKCSKRASFFHFVFRLNEAPVVVSRFTFSMLNTSETRDASVWSGPSVTNSRTF